MVFIYKNSDVQTRSEESVDCRLMTLFSFSSLAQFLKQHIMLSFDELLPGTEWDLGLSKRSWLVLIQEFRSPDKKWTINRMHSEKQVWILMPFLQNCFNSVIKSITQIQTNISRSRSSLLLSCKKKKSLEKINHPDSKFLKAT